MSRSRGFTIVEIMVVILVIGILFTGIYMSVQPYMSRSRDTKRITDMLGYLNNILVTYERNFDTFPSNYGSGGNPLALGYCLSEMTLRSNVSTLGNEGKFTTLSQGASRAPVDPINQSAYYPRCNMTGSYIYSRLNYGVDSQIAIIAARLETRTAANYGTGADLNNTAKIPDLINAKKSTIPANAPEQLYIVTALH